MSVRTRLNWSETKARRPVVIVHGFVPYDPFFPWCACPDPYPPYYIAANYGEVKIGPNHKFAEV